MNKLRPNERAGGLHNRLKTNYILMKQTSIVYKDQHQIGYSVYPAMLSQYSNLKPQYSF
jgi:hypothetical protein